MGARLQRVLRRLEKEYGKPDTRAPDPYEMLVVATCGYPASERACAKGFAALRASVGVEAPAILKAPRRRVVEAMRAGGIVPELRADRLRMIARSVVEEHGGDLRASLEAQPAKAMKILESFPTIATAGAEKILLFARLAPVMAVPSNATQVPLRLGFGEEGRSWAASYASTQRALADEIDADFAPRIRAHVLLKEHGQTVCKRARPLCSECPVTRDCAYFARTMQSSR